MRSIHGQQRIKAISRRLKGSFTALALGSLITSAAFTGSLVAPKAASASTLPDYCGVWIGQPVRNMYGYEVSWVHINCEPYAVQAFIIWGGLTHDFLGRWDWDYDSIVDKIRPAVGGHDIFQTVAHRCVGYNYWFYRAAFHLVVEYRGRWYTLGGVNFGNVGPEGLSPC